MKTATKVIVGVILLVIIVALAGLIAHKPVAAPQSSTASLTLLSPSGGSVSVGQKQAVEWTSQNYSAPTVSVDVIRKVGDNPARYELVRTISVATANDGSATWVPSASDIGNNTLIEVGCTLSAEACIGSQSPKVLAVVNNGAGMNTAAAYQAIEQMDNK